MDKNNSSFLRPVLRGEQPQVGQKHYVEEFFEVDSYLIRKSELDDCDTLNQLIEPHLEGLNNLFDYAKLLSLIERSYVAITVIDKDQNIIGCAVFNDFPQGLNGQIDFEHNNFWEYWLYQAFDFRANQKANAYNSLWLTYFFIAWEKVNLKQEERSKLIEKVFQNVYGTVPSCEYIFFLHRGEALGNRDSEQEIALVLDLLFDEIESTDRSILQKVQGIHGKSRLYITHRNKACDEVVIKMAGEEDHDDLAEVFNAQSEVLTMQFGEFFLADLIATQNQTRINTVKFQSNGRALVAKVANKAIGLMSLSTEIDYKLLASCYDLDIYDNLFKSDFMHSIRLRREEIREDKTWEEERRRVERQKRIKEETMMCRWIGQRLCLQQYCIEKESKIVFDINEFMADEKKYSTLTSKSQVGKLLDEWLKDFQYNQPSAIFKDEPFKDPDLLCIVQRTRNFLLETLVFFGLPKNYLDGEGHWKDYIEKKLEEMKKNNMKRPMKKHMKKTTQKKKKEDEKKEDELKPPPYFDLQPLLTAFLRFTSTTPELRAQFRKNVEQQFKRFIGLFTNENGELREGRCVDLNVMGAELNKQDTFFQIPAPICDNMPCILEAFGNIQTDTEIIKIEKKETTEGENKKSNALLAIKKLQEMNEPPKPQEIIKKKASFIEFKEAFATMKTYDLMMNRLGLIKSETLTEDNRITILEEQNAFAQEELRRKKSRKRNTEDIYYEHVKDLQDLNSIPDVPLEAQNAIVINLYCIDYKFESRGLDFLPYAFMNFKDKDYIILTQPHSIPESPLLQSFIQVPKKRESTFDHVLYIIHKDSLLCANALVVRKSKIEDILDMDPMLQDLIDRDVIVKDMNHAIKDLSSSKTAFSVFCYDQIIGMYVLSKNVNLDYYVSHFCIQDHIILNEHLKDSHSRLIHAVLNPLFSKCTRFILKEIMRYMNKTCLYFETHERTLLPDIFTELYIVRARKFPYFLKRKWDFQHEPEFLEKMGDKTDMQDGDRDAFDQEESPFSLSMITKKYLCSPKISVNNRIIVVGASDTGISFIESLLTIKDFRFPHIILLAPGGLLTMNVSTHFDLLKAISTNFTLEELRNLMFDARITVLDAKMMTLNKRQKTIGLDRNVILPYDILVSTVGLIDTQLQTISLVSSGVYVTSKYAGYADKKWINGVYSIDDPYLYQFFKEEKRKDSNIELLKRKRKPLYITVYGRTLHTICFINGLLNRGVTGDRINYIIPPRIYEKKIDFKSNHQRHEYEDHQINDPDPFEDSKIEEKILKILEDSGVTIYKECLLEEIITSEKSTICEKVIFKKNKPEGGKPEAPVNEKHGVVTEKHGHAKETHQQAMPNHFMVGQQQVSMEFDPDNLDEALESDKLELDSRFLITSGAIDIDNEIFNIIHENGLVYNGRLIIKSNFQTTEPVVFACGKICKFSERYKTMAVGTSLRLDKYNGRELGQQLAECVLTSLNLGYVYDKPSRVLEEELPSMYMPIGISGVLPGNLFYYYIKKPELFKPKNAWKYSKNREEIVSDNIINKKGQFLKFSFDNNGLIDAVTYLGDEHISEQSLVSFVGLSEKYLNQLRTRFENGLIPNISEFLSENWAIALYHEWFSEFRHITKDAILKTGDLEKALREISAISREGKYLDNETFEKMKGMVPKGIIKKIEENTLDFIRGNQNHLPMYYVSEKK